MKTIKCSTQEELAAALLVKDADIELHGSGEFTVDGSSQVRAYDSSQVTACESSQVRAYGSSQVTACDSSQVRAYGSSQVTACGSSQVTACGSSQVTAYDSSQVTAYGSSQVRACDSSQVRAYDSSQVTATKQVPVTVHGSRVKAEGGVQIAYTPPSTAQEWCENYGVEVKYGVAILFKGVNDDFTSPKKTSYAPGTMPEAPDWDGGKEECGGGLHFSPWPAMTYKYHPEAKRFVACPVMVEDIAVHVDAIYADKVKAPRVCAPCWEVDINGNRK